MSLRFARAGQLLVLALCVACGHQREAPDPATAAPKFLNHAEGVAYLGRDACRPCHLGIFSTYASTGMGRSLYPLARDNAVEDWSGNSEVIDEKTGLHYRVRESDGKFYQRQYVLDAGGKELAADERELTFVIGSNHHNRSYVLEVGDKLFQAPLCWYPQVSRWELCPGYEHQNQHFGREISESCVFCHNGRMERVGNERNAYRQPFPHGIDCERCHGPGQLHVARWSSGEDTPSGELDPTIVNPVRLPREARIEVCFQCHLGDSVATERVVRHDRSPTQYRPGQRITDVIVPFRYQEPTQHDFGLSAQADRLLLSRCYRESQGKIECLTCHDPHVTVYLADRPKDFFRQRCLGCHELDSCTAPAAERQRTAPPDDCVACHMRKAEPDDQRFTAFTDHWIRKDIHLTERDERPGVAVEPVIADHFATLPAAEQSFYRGRGGSLLARASLEPKVRGGMWQDAERSFKEATEKGFDVADAWFFLGKARLELRRPGEALASFDKAVAREPAHHDAALALGQAAVAAGQLPRALTLFEGMLARDPDDPMALAEAGRVRHMMGQTAEALASYERAVRLEPWNGLLHLNLG